MHVIVLILNVFMFQQFIYDYDGDYISIKDIDPDGNELLVAYLTGSDIGPKNKSVFSNWRKKIISSSRNQMNIEFRSDDFMEYKGFSANIYFTPIPNRECESWLNMNKKIFKSPNYPKTYTSKNCSWLITVEHENHITLNIIDLYVRVSDKI